MGPRYPVWLPGLSLGAPLALGFQRSSAFEMEGLGVEVLLFNITLGLEDAESVEGRWSDAPLAELRAHS